jgi:hypothetical protein
VIRLAVPAYLPHKHGASRLENTCRADAAGLAGLATRCTGSNSTLAVKIHHKRTQIATSKPYSVLLYYTQYTITMLCSGYNQHAMRTIPSAYFTQYASLRVLNWHSILFSILYSVYHLCAMLSIPSVCYPRHTIRIPN